MQTFLPYADFAKTASVLDYRRLGKQRIEAKQILRILLDETESKGWRNHPAVLMWSGYPSALAHYAHIICLEWRQRGYNDNQLDYFAARIGKVITVPEWMGWDDFHVSHQSNLIRKFPEHYTKYFPNVPDNLEYIWPSKVTV